MRELLRALARTNMEKAGVRKMNKKGPDGRSYFSKNWRKWI